VFFHRIGSLRTFAALANKIYVKSEGGRPLCGTKPPFAGAAIAHAAFPPACSIRTSAIRQIALNRPFNHVKRVGVQTDLLLRLVPKLGSREINGLR